MMQKIHLVCIHFEITLHLTFLCGVYYFKDCINVVVLIPLSPLY